MESGTKKQHPLNKGLDQVTQYGPPLHQGSRPKGLTTATTANDEGDSDESDSVEGEYGNEPIEDDNDDAYYDEQE